MTPTDLRTWRTAAQLSQAELADLLGVDHTTVSRWELGKMEIPAYLHLALRELSRPKKRPVRQPLFDGQGNETERYSQIRERYNDMHKHGGINGTR